DATYTTFYRGPLTMADGAAQYDSSLAWHPWVGAVESLELLVKWQAAGALEQPVTLARALADRLGIPWGGGTLVCPQIDHADKVRAVLADQRIKAAFRGMALRLSTHVYNAEADIERAAAALARLVAQAVVR